LYTIIGTLLPFALGIAISPVSIIAAILLLTSKQGTAKGLAYLAGWLAGLMTLVVALLVLVSSRGSTAVQFTAWVILSAGIILLIMAYIQWRQRPPRDAEIAPLEWLRAIPRTTSFMALSAGLFFSLFSVKNLLIVTATAAVIGEAGLGMAGRITAVLIFVTVATLGIAVPAYIAFAQGERAKAILTDWEYRLSVHNVTITCIVLVTIAVQLLGAGLIRLL